MPPNLVTENDPPAKALAPGPAPSPAESPTAKLQPHSATILFLQYSPDGKYLATASKDKTVKLWDAVTRQQVRQLTGHTGEVTCVAFSPDSKRLASGSMDATVRLWEVATGSELGKPLRGHTAGVSAVAFSNDGKLLASGGGNSARDVRLWHLSAKPEGRKLGGHNGIIGSIAFSRDDKTLVTGSWDDTVRFWNVDTGEERRPPMPGRYVCVSPDGGTLFVGTGDTGEKGILRRFEMGTWKEQGEKLEVDREGFEWMALSADGKLLAVVGHDGNGQIVLVDVTDPQYPATGKRRNSMGFGTITSFSRDGKTLACGGSPWDKNATTVRLLDASTLEYR